jgi:CubicO group peptidase (beta-lactamase class C family)
MVILMRRWSAAIVLLIGGMLGSIGAPSPAVAPDDAVVRGERAERIDRFLTNAVNSGFNGSVLIAEDGRIILERGYGWADRERTKRVRPDAPFWIASISKQFAAAAVLKLAERGRLSLQDSIGRLLPSVPPDKRSITVHQLLTHTAGLTQHYAADGIADRDAAVRAILAFPLGGVPGGGFEYSNDAYNLVAAIVEITSGRPYEDIVRGQLLGPAGPTHTGFWGPADHPEVASILGREIPDTNVARPNWGFRGATGMYSTVGDLYRWYLALEGGRVLSEGSVRRLFTPYVKRGATGVGYGWFVSQTPRNTESIWTRGYESFGHGAVLAVYPRERVVIAVTSNSGEAEHNKPVSHKLAQDIADRLFASP